MNPHPPVAYVHGFLLGIRSQTTPEAILHTLNHSRAAVVPGAREVGR